MQRMRTHKKWKRLFSLWLPDEEQTLLLRACLQPDRSGREAWEAWKARVGDYRGFLVKERQGVKRLLPLLHHNLLKSEAAVEQSFSSTLETACMREEIQSETFLRVCGEVLTVLRGADIDFIVLKGTALAETVYKSLVLRPCRDVDIFVNPKDQVGAAQTLKETPFGLSAGPANGSGSNSVAVELNSGLSVKFHVALFSAPYYEPPMQDLWERTKVREIAGTNVRVFEPADMLLHVCGHAAGSSSRDTLRWVCDARILLENTPNFPWDRFVDTALRGRLALPLWIMLGYLAEELAAPVPGEVLKALASEAGKTDKFGLETALSCVRLGRRGTYRDIFRTIGNWNALTVMMKWVLFPSNDFLRWKYDVKRPWHLPFTYLYRLFRYISEFVQKRRRLEG